MLPVIYFVIATGLLASAHAGSDDDVAQAFPVTVQLPGWYFLSNGSFTSAAFQGHQPLQDAHAVHPDVGDESKWSGQVQEDLFAYRHFFFKQTNGVFLEMGGYDGVTFSNSLKLEQELGWRGMLIEPEPDLYKSLVQNRPNAVCVNMAACDRPQVLHFVTGHTVWGGIYEFMSKAFMEYNGMRDIDPSTLPEVTCMPLHVLLRRLGLAHINLLSLDVEGGELAVLKSLDFNRFTVDVLVVENDGHAPEKDEAVRHLLAAAGYRLYAHPLPGSNDWFVREGFKPSRDPSLPAELENDLLRVLRENQAQQAQQQAQQASQQKGFTSAHHHEPQQQQGSLHGIGGAGSQLAGNSAQHDHAHGHSQQPHVSADAGATQHSRLHNHRRAMA